MPVRGYGFTPDARTLQQLSAHFLADGASCGAFLDGVDLRQKDFLAIVGRTRVRSRVLSAGISRSGVWPIRWTAAYVPSAPLWKRRSVRRQPSPNQKRGAHAYR